MANPTLYEIEGCRVLEFVDGRWIIMNNNAWAVEAWFHREGQEDHPYHYLIIGPYHHLEFVPFGPGVALGQIIHRKPRKPECTLPRPPADPFERCDAWDLWWSDVEVRCDLPARHQPSYWHHDPDGGDWQESG